MPHAYDRTYDPPAPVLPLVLRGLGGEDAVTVLALADTGADVTIVPQAIAERLLDASGPIVIAGIGGDMHDVVRYRAEVETDGRREIVEVVGWGTDTIAGRDLLNRWVAVFDGPGGVLDLQR